MQYPLRLLLSAILVGCFGSPAAAQLVRYFPHLAAGPSRGMHLETSLVLSNPGSTRTEAILSLFSISAPGQTEFFEPGASSLTLTLEPQQVVVVRSRDQDQLTSGAARLLSTGELHATTLFKIFDQVSGTLQGQLGINVSEAMRHFFFPFIFDESFATAFACFNFQNTSNTLRLRLWGSSGQVVATRVQEIQGISQFAGYVPGDLFPGTIPISSGTIEVSCDRPIVAMAALQDPHSTQLAALPSIPADWSSTEQALPVVGAGRFGSLVFQSILLFTNLSSSSAVVDLRLLPEPEGPDVLKTRELSLGPYETKILRVEGEGSFTAYALQARSSEAFRTVVALVVRDPAGQVRSLSAMEAPEARRRHLIPVEAEEADATALALLFPSSDLQATPVTLASESPAGAWKQQLQLASNQTSSSYLREWTSEKLTSSLIRVESAEPVISMSLTSRKSPYLLSWWPLYAARNVNLLERITPSTRVFYDNDGVLDSYTDELLLALQESGEIQMEGFSTTSSIEPFNQYVSEGDFRLFVEERLTGIERAEQSGFKKLPTHYEGVMGHLLRPDSGEVGDTVPLEAPAVVQIIQAAQRATPAEPLLVVVGGPLTTIASAYLRAPEISDRVLVAWLGGRSGDAGDYNGWSDPWAAYIVLLKLPLILFESSQAGKFQAPSVEKERLMSLPPSPLREWMINKQHPNGLPDERDADAAPVIPLSRGDYILRTQTVSFTHWTEWQGRLVPAFLPDPEGSALLVTELNREVGTEAWWQSLTNSAIWTNLN